jgi:hypothetical protein
MAPLRIRYCGERKSARRVCNGTVSELTVTHPLVSKLAIAVVRGSLNREGHGADHESPLDADFIDNRTAHEAD